MRTRVPAGREERSVLAREATTAQDILRELVSRLDG